MKASRITSILLASALAAPVAGCTVALKEAHVAKRQNFTREDTAALADYRATSKAKLADTVYLFRWVAPDRLAETPLHEMGTCELRAPYSGQPAIYADHVDPLYNIHCHLVPGWTMPMVEKARGSRAWNEYWRDLAAKLSGKVRYFAVVAYADGRQAGQVRFFPDGVTQLGPPSDGQHLSAKDRILRVAGVVDLAGADDGLDVELLCRVLAYARSEGYAKVSGLGISNIAPYAMWAEQFTQAAYEAAGFRRMHAVDPAIPDGFEDMLAGAHGDEVQKMVQEALAGGMTKDEANTFYTMEVDLRTD